MLYSSLVFFVIVISGAGTPHCKAVPVNIPVKPLVPRPPMRNSIEGLNQEIERLVLKAGGAQDTEREEEKVRIYISC